MKTKLHLATDGVLVLPDLDFSRRSPHMPHRSHTLATHQAGRFRFLVEANHKRSLFWIHATGPGFAGDHSRASETSTTRSPERAAMWITKVNAGQVRLAP